jgi:hypothetical protein
LATSSSRSLLFLNLNFIPMVTEMAGDVPDPQRFRPDPASTCLDLLPRPRTAMAGGTPLSSHGSRRPLAMLLPPKQLAG